MPRGPGKYGDLCHRVHQQIDAKLTVLIVIDAEGNNSFDVEGDIVELHELPKMFRDLANALEKDLKKGIV